MNRKLASFLIPALTLAVTLTCGLTLAAQSNPQPAPGKAGKSVLDGVYTDVQAKRGEAEFGTRCGRCHEGADVDGPALTGDPFIDRWREDNLNSLFTFLKTNMPQDAPGSLSSGAYVDLLAYLLHANTFPAGAKELTADALGNTQLVGKDGPKPLPANSVVLAVGCFTPGPNNAWTLTSASDPVRNRTADETNPEELKSSAAKPLGTQAIRLQNLDSLGAGFSPDAHRGQKVQVKGVLIRQTNNSDRINVLSLETVAARCAP
jgi:mono/diheme cytochrome c family protein